MPSTLPPGTDVCALADIVVDGAIVVVLGRGPATTEVIVVRDAGGVRGFFNVCPHNPLPLNIDSRIYSAQHLIYCDHHFATFRFADGVCVAGACIGEALTPVALRIDSDERVRVAVEARFT